MDRATWLAFGSPESKVECMMDVVPVSRSGPRLSKPLELAFVK